MSSKLCLILFIAQAGLCLTAIAGIDQAAVANVFGSPTSYNPQLGGKQPNQTLQDPDYWDVDDYSPSLDKFDWTLNKHVAAGSDTNFLLSPLGLKLALALLTEAATGPTQAELSSVLGFDLNRTVVRRSFWNVLDSITKPSPQYKFNLGSRIYLEKNAEPRQRFAAIAQQAYKTELVSADFDNPVATAKEINDWVSKLTSGSITDLVTEDEVAAMVVMVLNTLYFKGTWLYQFTANETQPNVFHVSPKAQTNARFMHVRNKFYYYESNKFDSKIVRLPYVGDKFAMYLVVPNSLTGLPNVMNKLNELRTETYYLREQLVDITMPKFNMEHSALLDGVLRELGVRQAFEDTASFPGLARGQLLHQRLRISKILQRVGVDINEAGSIAYSATEVSLVNKFGEDTEYSVAVVANRPFFFFIQEEATRQLLFTGRVSDPTGSRKEGRKG